MVLILILKRENPFLQGIWNFFFNSLSVDLILHNNNKQHTKIHTCSQLLSDLDTFYTPNYSCKHQITMNSGTIRNL